MRVARGGFTLGEVAIALLILTTAIVAVLMLLATGLRHQEQARYRTFASAAALTVAEAFAASRESFDSGGIALDVAGNLAAIDTPTEIPGQMRGLWSLMASGRYDIEQVAGNSLAGIYPVPEEIVRRLDSPDDEIRRLANAGQALFYVDPYGGGLYTRDAAKSGGQRGAVPELQRLVFAVVGAPQQNALNHHPVVLPPYRVYPFPPQARTLYNPRRWQRSVGTFAYSGYPQGFDGDLRAEEPAIDSNGRVYWNPQWIDLNYEEGNTWEWLAYVDELRARSDAPSGRWTPSAGWSPWRAGLPEFRRLTNAHWLRIHHHYWRHPFTLPSRTGTIRRHNGRTIPREVVDHTLYIDAVGNVRTEERKRTIQEPDPNGWYETIGPIPGGEKPVMGMPAPANGLPMARGLRGTDVLYDDHETCMRDRGSQIRIGLPGLERRVMYRTAALALWARVDGHRPIMSAEPRVLGTASDPAADPNVADQIANLPDERNPLLGVVEPPPNAREIHPAQVLALSHLAHAAVVVTGYKPPFVDEADSLDPIAHRNMVPDEGLPWKQLGAEEYYLWDPSYVSANPTGASGGDADQSTPPPLLPTASTAANDPRIARDMAGDPIVVRRATGPVLNPFPPPYADRGAFDHAGVRYATFDEPPAGGGATHLRRVRSHGRADLAGKDTQHARNALETCLRWAMAYVSEHPEDLIVPKPMNRQTAFDRPIFAFDLFPGGSPRRPGVATGAQASYPVIWGSDRATFPMPGKAPFAAHSAWHYRAWGGDPASPTAHRNPVATGAVRNPAAPTASYLDWLALGAPLPGTNALADPRTGSARDYRRGFGGMKYSWNSGGSTWSPRREQAPWDVQALLNRLHGIADPGDDPVADAQARRLDPATSPGAGRFRINRPFAVADRCRQLVFWAVDWKSYEDAESLPSAPYDASRRDGDGQRARGNPEIAFAWANPARDATTSRIPRHLMSGTFDARDDYMRSGWDFRGIYYADATDASWRLLGHPYVNLGFWGADRNGNGTWDRGPIKPGTRLRATEVARFVVYDPVLRLSMGQ